jgi:hypothetical protein
MASLKFAIECRGIIMRARIRFPLYVAGRRVKKFLGMPSASTLTRRPAPGLLRLGFRAGRSVCRKIVANRVTEQVSHAEADEGNRQTVC